MECAVAERLRNVALVSISRELRVLVERRYPSSKHAEKSVGKGQNVVLLRQHTDTDRKALQDHMKICMSCRLGVRKRYRVGRRTNARL
jgi:hypothetical protein